MRTRIIDLRDKKTEVIIAKVEVLESHRKELDYIRDAFHELRNKHNFCIHEYEKPGDKGIVFE